MRGVISRLSREGDWRRKVLYPACVCRKIGRLLLIRDN
jgi:hypothetical protein